uniref:hypothetical protein n=1 Tax=Serratia marcescens TaxID=615 RepID=UPI003F7455D2
MAVSLRARWPCSCCSKNSMRSQVRIFSFSGCSKRTVGETSLMQFNPVGALLPPVQGSDYAVRRPVALSPERRRCCQ